MKQRERRGRGELRTTTKKRAIHYSSKYGPLFMNDVRSVFNIHSQVKFSTNSRLGHCFLLEQHSIFWSTNRNHQNLVKSVNSQTALLENVHFRKYLRKLLFRRCRTHNLQNTALDSFMTKKKKKILKNLRWFYLKMVAVSLFLATNKNQASNFFEMNIIKSIL